MPRDATMPFDRESGGDVAWVDGKEFFYNHALQLGLIAAEDISGGAMTAADISAAESKISSQISSSPFFESPVLVTIDVQDDVILRASVSVNNIDETLELPIGEI